MDDRAAGHLRRPGRGRAGYGSLRPHPLNPLALALVALAAVAGRLVMTFRAFLELLNSVQVEALTDVLTGLPNRAH